MKTKQLAIVLLASSLAYGVSADENQSTSDSDSAGTYWGLGIGSVLGGLIAGPPGVAVGAALGGSFGWGQDKDSALENSMLELDQHQLALQQSEEKLRHSLARLNEIRQKNSTLSRENAQQSAQLASLQTQKSQGDDHGHEVLEQVIANFAHEIYYRNGESDVPGYAQSRLAGLSDFLKSHPDLQVQVKGYTDHRGPADLNAALAEARVAGIRAALMAQGIDPQRISVQALGETESEAREGDAANYVLDRRVSIELSVGGVDMPSIASIGEVAP